jgi:hypothetical protein
MRWVLAVCTAGSNSDGAHVTTGSHYLAGFCCVCADVILSIDTEEVEPHNRIVSEAAVSPKPTVYVVDKGLRAPVLETKSARDGEQRRVTYFVVVSYASKTEITPINLEFYRCDSVRHGIRPSYVGSDLHVLSSADRAARIMSGSFGFQCEGPKDPIHRGVDRHHILRHVRSTQPLEARESVIFFLRRTLNGDIVP